MTTTKSGDWSSKAGGGARAITRGSDPGDECIGCSHSRGSHDRSDGSCIYCNCPEFKGAPHPGPLTDLVLAALPANGAGLFLGDVIERLPADHMSSTFTNIPTVVRETLDVLVERGVVRRLDGCYARVVAAGAPPAWLTAAVLAALPASGVPCSVARIRAQIVVTTAPTEDPPSVGQTERALAHLVSTGEIEAGEQPGTWRRWGVPEGWAFRPETDVMLSALMPDNAEPDDECVATADRDGTWVVYERRATRIKAQGTATPPTLAAARTAALRACHERGVFALASAPTPAPSPPPDPAASRPERLRAALLAVLAPGPVRTTAALLPALDAAMGERAGVAVATGAEAMCAAREIGARVDGVEWSLPVVPDGWGWRPWQGDGLFLAPLDASNVADASIAMAAPEWWEMYKPGPGGEVIEQAPCASVEGGQAAALTAARLAGLFAAPRAEVAAPVAPAPVEAPTGPLDALARRLCGAHLYAAGSSGMAAVEGDVVALTPLLAAWGADVVDAARAAVEALPALRALMARRTLDASGVLRVYGEDGATVVHEERVGEPSAALDERGPWQRTIDYDAAKREDEQADAADPLRRAVLAASSARQRLRTADPGTDEWSAAEIEVARTTGALLDVLGVEVGDPAADARHAQRIAENERDEAVRERDEARALLSAEVKARVAAEHDEESAARERDEARATIAKIGAMLDPVLAAIAGGRSGAGDK